MAGRTVREVAKTHSTVWLSAAYQTAKTRISVRLMNMIHVLTIYIYFDLIYFITRHSSSSLTVVVYLDCGLASLS